MTQAIETTATLEDDRHLTLHQPVSMASPAQVTVLISIDEDTELADDPVVQKLSKMTPEERAAEFLAWADSHKDGVGLSDYAVSRDSIYD